VAARFGVLALCAVLAVGTGDALELRLQFLLLLVLAAVMSLPTSSTPWSTWRPVVEGLSAALIVGTTATSVTALLPYLVVAPAAAGLLTGFLSVFLTVAVTAVPVALLRHPSSVIERTELAEWIGLGLAVGLLAAWARATTREAATRAGSYAAANRLLAELGEVARGLPTGLDEVSLAQGLLDDLAERTPFDRGALYARTDSGHLVPMAFWGAERLEWDPTGGEPWARAWRSRRPEQEPGLWAERDHGHGHRAVVPLQLGDRSVGLIAVEREGEGWSRTELAAAQVVADEAVLRLDTGRLFSELRALATVEERRRLAREIHDGVAQEVAALGFFVDDLATRTSDLTMRAELRDLRAQLTRIVSELRLSIFDLRSDVEPATGLGAALGSYVRQVGTGSGMTVHLVLDESAVRLPVDVETELLRIAQEAIANARKHSRARNLWVTCRVDPPRAFLRVADDGQGLGSPRHDSYGLDITRERTQRLGATLSVRNRVGGGTVVEVGLDGALPRLTGTAGAPQGRSAR
jgi:signal transduction histidine kinase